MIKTSLTSLRIHDYGPYTDRLWFYVFNKFSVELDDQTVNWVISDSCHPLLLVKANQKANMAPHAYWNLHVMRSVKYSLSSHWQKLCQHHWFTMTTGKTRRPWREISYDPMTILPSHNLGSLWCNLTTRPTGQISTTWYFLWWIIVGIFPVFLPIAI